MLESEYISISRIPIIPSDIFPFHMKRKEFPVRPAFASTANKAQGHTLSHVGIYLKQDFFSHGQFYVAMSRVGSKDSLKIYSGHEVYTSNVVYKGVCISEQGKSYYDIIVAFIEQVLYL